MGPQNIQEQTTEEQNIKMQNNNEEQKERTSVPLDQSITLPDLICDAVEGSIYKDKGNKASEWLIQTIEQESPEDAQKQQVQCWPLLLGDGNELCEQRRRQWRQY
jgi:hypothetical protein